MFVQGKRPALVVPEASAVALHVALRRAGYSPHLGARWQRDGELRAWSLDLPRGRHVHVQEVSWGRGRIALFAHTEPASGLAHVFSALTDGANYSAGARKLRADLHAAGFSRPSKARRRPRRRRAP